MFDFDQAFSALSGGYRPFKWQSRLFGELCKGEIPSACRLPTGLGKTSIIPIWLLALAQAGESSARIPRRLIYIVNRRTVVDQATDDARRLLECLYQVGRTNSLPWSTADSLVQLGLASSAALNSTQTKAVGLLSTALSRLCGDDSIPPLAISTLRGELADNGDWKRNPARASIVIGTIDMIGSKLLFSGYGDRRYGRAHHAGLVGQDTFIVHDESHLSPAFDALLASIESEQQRTKEPHPVRVMRLSATTRATAGTPTTSDCFDLMDADLDGVVTQRLTAKKTLELKTAESGKFVESVVKEAISVGSKKVRVLIYVRSPVIAAKIAAGIKKALGADNGARVGLLTGEIRGFERDELARSPLFQSFRSSPNRAILNESIFLVSTSAGEVGADLDADHLVCDSSTLDSMAQRFGRVNRLGGADRASTILVLDEESKEKKVEDDEEEAPGKKPSPVANAVLATKKILKDILKNSHGDVSPKSLGDLIASLSTEEVEAAFSPKPTILPATDILFDSWSLTSIEGKLPGRPEVGPYLHGVPEQWDPPETHVAWRADISLLARAGNDGDGVGCPVSQDELNEVFDAFPLRSIETLRGPTDRVMKELQQLASVHPARLVVVIARGTASWVELQELAPDGFDMKRIASSPLAYATVVLPTEIGGFDGGCLNGAEKPSTNHKTLDVAEKPIGGVVERQRVIVGGTSDAIAGRPLLAETPIVAISRLDIALSANSEDESDSGITIEYRVVKGHDRESGTRVKLSEHNDAVGSIAARFGTAVGLPDDISNAVSLAGSNHDLGKDRERWQRYASNVPTRSDPGGSIAKSDEYLHGKALGGYRHEFGSLLDASIGIVGGAPNLKIANHPERDLILHLIAAHHGWARPHFEPKHFDPSPRPSAQSEQASLEVLQRFGKLQQRFGRWGLAWLESLVRCADAQASSAPTSRKKGQV